MGMVSFTTVASFESVGAILVVTFLIAPPATAYLLTTNFKKMLFLSFLCGIIAAVGGYYIASYLDASIAGGMSVMSGFTFLIVLLFSPYQGVFRQLYRTKTS
jgi:manganese/zinc/iron transport system permease protein